MYVEMFECGFLCQIEQPLAIEGGIHSKCGSIGLMSAILESWLSMNSWSKHLKKEGSCFVKGNRLYSSL